MNRKPGTKIGEGGCSEIYEWEDGGKIVKLAKPNTTHEAMKREYEQHVAAWKCGLPVARPYEFLEIDGRPGIVFERIYGETLMERLIQPLLDPRLSLNEENFRITARMLSEVHRQKNVRLSSIQRENIISSIHRAEYLTPVEKESVISILKALPVKQVLCHGDPNPGNILVNRDGGAVFIDWMNASIGNPEADLAEYIIMVRYAVLPPSLPDEASKGFDEWREPMIEMFMDEYTRLTGVTYEDVRPWLAPVAARKLTADAISDEEKQLLVREIRKTLAHVEHDEAGI